MSADPAAALKALVEALARDHGAEPADPSADLCPDGCDGPLHELVYSFLLWEASHALASKALAAVGAAFVDYNELRICYPEEIVPLLGPRYPRADERAARLHAALNHVFVRENGMTLARLIEAPKRDARVYLGEVEGAPPFVSARVSAVSLGAHAFPVDDRVAGVLRKAGVIEEGVGAEEACGRLERLLRAGESLPVYLLLEASLNGAAPARAGKGAGAKARKSPRTAGDTPPVKTKSGGAPRR